MNGQWLNFVRISSLIFICILISLLNACTQNNTSLNKISDEFRSSLINDIMNIWYPKAVDTVHGGFLSDFDSQWKEQGQQNKMLVSQSRHIWTLSKMYELSNDIDYLKYATGGFNFLEDEMWDFTNGGFYQLTDREGKDIPNIENDKSSYSISFSLYALAAYFKVSSDSSALELARKTFLWLEKNAHDKINKGYFDLLTKDGSIRELSDIKRNERYSIHPSWKDQNSSIHLLEAFTELYSVWPDTLLKERLNEMLLLIRDKIVKDEKYLSLYLKSDWTPISFRDSSSNVRDANYHLDHVSFGHDIETAFLMLEASHILGIENDEKTLRVAKSMVDHSLNYGWDDEDGGFYYEGYYYNENDELKIINRSKVWWVQAEGLNSLLLMSKLFPNDPKYLNSFKQQWNYIKKYMIDYDNGGWYENGLDIDPEYINAPKAHIWKVNYHNVRALMHCIKTISDM